MTNDISSVGAFLTHSEAEDLIRQSRSPSVMPTILACADSVMAIGFFVSTLSCYDDSRDRSLAINRLRLALSSSKSLRDTPNTHWKLLVRLHPSRGSRNRVHAHTNKKIEFLTHGLNSIAAAVRDFTDRFCRP